MAVAARPGPSDARLPCPLCGGLIHPIAGKCKHCKADLSTYHAARPAANTPLPALRAGHDAAALAVTAHAVPMPAAREPSAPVLPPRPTGRAPAAPAHASGWRSWPVLVIIVAGIAIVVAAVLMVWPPSRGQGGDAGKHVVQPPAPERMDTQNPGMAAPRTQPAPRPDPWSQPHAAVPSPHDPSADLTPPDDSHDDQDSDPDAVPPPTPRGRPAPRRGLTVNTSGVVMLAMAVHLCRKMVQCGNDDLTTKSMCDTVASSATDIPANCPAANRCLERIDAMSCSSQNDDLSQLTMLLTQFRDCADAVRC